MDEKKYKVKNIFDSIAERYDFLNHFLSFGVDRYWRKKALKLTNVGSKSILLDVACGTGDVAIEAYKQGVENYRQTFHTICLISRRKNGLTESLSK
jgi:demethylmenaquinone methyltransferase/2-methoxy-6-polyprenyl-1,4-benzoquinol methylase